MNLLTCRAFVLGRELLIPSVVLSFALSLVDSAALANNGEIAYAYPRDGIAIDGDLSDWDDARQYPIERSTSESDVGADFKASFRVAYNLPARSLYVAVEVLDDAHTVASSDAPDWTTQDTHLLYIDRQHLPSGSGAALLQFGGGFQEISTPRSTWDPANANTSWDDVEVEVVRRGDRTIYEWRLDLGRDLVPNRSLGLDHLLTDRDEVDRGDTSLWFWGEGLGKSANSYRMGDVVLLPPEAKLGTVHGKLGWRAAIDDPLPSQVRIRSTEHPALWVQARVDESGRYTVELPEGSYRVSSAYRLTKPFRVDFNNFPLRIDDAAHVLVKVAAGQTATSPDLLLPTETPPEHLYRRRGVLHDFGPSQAAAVDEFIEAYMRYYDVPGVSIALVKDGKLAYHRTFGVRNTLTREAVEATTLFEAASITKAVFAFAVMRLAERGVIDLDRPVYQYLPFENIADDPRSKKITARIVLSHQSGLPNWAWGGPGVWEGQGNIDLNFEPGTRFGYSGEAFNYLGRVIEAVTGKELGVVLGEEVLIPMGMKNAYFSLDNEQAAAASIGHFHHFPVWRERARFASPASSMHTEARDFANFMIGLIERKGLSSKSYEAMLESQFIIPAEERLYEDGWEQSLGLGLFLQDTPFGQLIQHGGNNDDFDCKFGVVLEAGIGYAIFTNNNVGDEFLRALEILLLRGKPFRAAP